MNNINKIIILVGLLITAICASVDTVKYPVLDLEDMVVTYQADKKTPITYQNLDKDYIDTKSIGQEPSFLLSQTPSITNYSDAGNSQGYSYFRMRGIDQTRLNITLDGVPLNEPEDQGAYFSNHPDILNSVSKIQIQRGVGTSKNGVGSYGGSIQLFSPIMYDSNLTTLGFSYGSYNSMNGFLEYNSGVKNGKALYIRTSQIHSDGYKDHSSNTSRSVFLSSSLFGDNSTWKLNVLAGNQKNDMAWLGVSDSLIKVDRKTNTNSNEKDDFTQALIQVKNNYLFTSKSILETSVYYTYLNGNYDFDLNNFLGFPSTNEMYNYAFESHFAGFFSNYSLSYKNIDWITGIHVSTYGREHIGTEATVGRLYKNNGYRNEASAFTKFNYGIGKLNLFSDVQFRYSTFKYAGNTKMDNMDWFFVNPKAGLSYAVKKNLVTYYSVGSTSREPTRNDMFGGNDDLLADSLGNAVLSIKSPEKVIDHEFGVRFKSKNLNVNTNLYYLDFSNEIVLDGKFGPNGLALTDKVDKSIRTGIEVNVDYKLTNNITLVNNSSYSYNKIEEQSESFDPILTPPLIINQEVVYTFDRFAIGLSGRFQDESFIDYANTSKLESYYTLNGRIGYNINRFHLSLVVNNITNEEYFNNGYVDWDGSNKYFVQSPVNFSSTIKYTF